MRWRFEVIEHRERERFETLLEAAVNDMGFEVVGGLMHDGHGYKILVRVKVTPK